ncbi:MAG: bifunctional hydroxymethylpyrimidine kinase/phosphomethylpyrimidine kinase [Eubacterium sp.]|nr:bifunctional hydroxymethylpyrimidine kinase/phosphomethylpyrimidine kinase [Eubacterium sp.]
MRKVLTIAGSDSSGGAGIQADLKTFAAHGVYGMSVITAVTAQNTTGVFGVENISPKMVAAQLDAVFSDIVPDAVKIGMVSSGEIIEVIAEKLRQYQPRHVVLDPVMVATSGDALFEASAQQTLTERLMPLATIITPNLSEAQLLAGMTIVGREDMLAAARRIAAFYPGAILIKGGHLEGQAADLLWQPDAPEIWLFKDRVETNNTHGTGCTLSSAIAANLALGHGLPEAVALAKDYVYGALAWGMDLGRGNGPLNHLYRLFETL